MTTTQWAAALSSFTDYLAASGAPRTTIEQRLYHLGRYARDSATLGPAEVTFDHLVKWLAESGWKPNTMRAYRGSLRVFYSWAMATGVVTTSPAHLLPSVKVPRSKPRPTPETAYRDGLASAPARIRRAIELGGHCGLRRGEIARVRTYDVEVRGQRWKLRVIGKGGHERVVPLPEHLARELTMLPPGWVFPSPSGGHLTPAHLGKLVKAWLVDQDGHYTTHTLRHRCGTLAYRNGGKDPRAVQELLGHAKLDTIVIYTQIDDDAIHQAMEGAA